MARPCSAYDNVGSIVKLYSDALCQVISGTGFNKRRLYTDLDQIQVGGYRPIIITSVHNPITETDLADRALTLHPAVVDPDGGAPIYRCGLTSRGRVRLPLARCLTSSLTG